MITTVWLFLILGVTPASHHQVIDLFPSQVACEEFRLNVQQMLAQGAAPGSRVTDCLSRPLVTTGAAQKMKARGNRRHTRAFGALQVKESN